MALEDLTGTGKFISALNPTWPTDDDWVDEGDNHLRGIKNVLKNTFPNIDGAVTLSEEQLNGTLVAVPESRIINGNFAIDQRRAGGIHTINNWNMYAVDRWTGGAIGGGVFTVQQSRAQYASEQTLLHEVTTPDATLAAADLYATGTKIEGFGITDLHLGSGSAMPFTFACSINVSVAGTYPVSFRNSGATLSYVTTVTLPAGVWTPVALTIPGATTGTWEATNALGMEIYAGLGVGSTYNAPAANTWASGNYVGVAGCTNLMATAGARIFIANARLYPGTVDYGPCRRLYADELRLCQRYYAKSYDIGTVPGTAGTTTGALTHAAAFSGAAGNFVMTQFPVSMRAAPAVTGYNPSTGASGSWWRASAGAAVPVAAVLGSENSVAFYNNGAVTVGEQIQGHWTASAEL